MDEQTATNVTASAPVKKTMEVVDIRRLLPHRYPFLLLDRIIEIVPKQRIVAIKNVTANEEFFQGHFPEFPLMPGVLMIEAMAQAGGVLLLTEIADRENKLMVFTGIERARFRRQVIPGDQLRLEVEVRVWRRNAVRLQGFAYVGDKKAAEATISAQLTSLAPQGQAAETAAE